MSKSNNNTSKTTTEESAIAKEILAIGTFTLPSPYSQLAKAGKRLAQLRARQNADAPQRAAIAILDAIKADKESLLVGNATSVKIEAEMVKAIVPSLANGKFAAVYDGETLSISAPNGEYSKD